MVVRRKMKAMRRAVRAKVVVVVEEEGVGGVVVGEEAEVEAIEKTEFRCAPTR